MDRGPPYRASFAFTTRPAHPRLQPWILGCWEFHARDGAPPEHHVPPDGTAILALVERGDQPAGLVAFGPRAGPLIIPTAPGVAYRGLRLAPEAAPLLLGESAARLITGPVAVCRIGPVDTGSIVAALRSGSPDNSAVNIDGLFLPVIDRLPIPDPVVATALLLIRQSQGRDPLSDIAHASGVSPRTLLRRVKSATGLSPKQHARIARFFAAAQGLLDPAQRLVALAQAGGYADQPHFHHEVTALTGLTPAQLAQRVRQTEHHLDR